MHCSLRSLSCTLSTQLGTARITSNRGFRDYLDHLYLLLPTTYLSVRVPSEENGELEHTENNLKGDEKRNCWTCNIKHQMSYCNHHLAYLLKPIRTREFCPVFKKSSDDPYTVLIPNIHMWKNIYFTGVPRGPRGSQKSFSKFNDAQKLFQVVFVKRLFLIKGKKSKLFCTGGPKRAGIPPPPHVLIGWGFFKSEQIYVYICIYVKSPCSNW